MKTHLKKLVILGAAYGALASGLPAMAADFNTPADPSIAKAPDPQAPPPGPLSGLGHTLHDAGFDVRINFVDLYANASNFGFDPGHSGNFGFLMFDTTYHLSDMFKINWQETVNIPRYNANQYLFQVSNAFYATDPSLDSSTDLTRLTLQGDFIDGKLEVEGGRLNMWPEFFRSEFCGGKGCISQTRALVLGAPGNTVAQWGGRVGYNLTPDLSLGGVLTEDNAENWQTGSGWNWGRGDSKGYTAVVHLAQRQNFLETSKPLIYEIGGYRSSASYTDALYGTGWGNPTFGANQTVTEHDGGSNGLFAQVRKVIWSDPDGSPFPENVAISGGIFHTFGDGQAYPWEAYGSIEYGGFWKANPLTSIGATVHYIGLSEKRAQYETNARRFLTGIYDPQPRDTFQFDLHGRTGIGPAGFLEFGASYVKDPNTTYLADYSTSRMKNGWTIYAAIVFDLGTALGLSPPPQP
ncbi:carbohydrate porin (plasmid) [Agrobacterium vitis]|uniref:carbohydrate porin n=1 Tax=Agrobacterium vitis TaxID=373 RepID=UPI0012E79362|nr:carbohydrate porin [Agrobacterium vitis]MVA27749.1 porin [Agrobacterium vitis]